MRYNYKRSKCKNETQVTKPMADSSREEFCKDCDSKLTRVYSVAVKTGDGGEG